MSVSLRAFLVCGTWAWDQCRSFNASSATKHSEGYVKPEQACRAAVAQQVRESTKQSRAHTCAITAAGSSGASRYFVMQPTTCASRTPSACLVSSVYRPPCATSASRIAESPGRTPTAQTPQPLTLPCASQSSRALSASDRMSAPQLIAIMRGFSSDRSYASNAAWSLGCAHQWAGFKLCRRGGCW